jgi:hypothetical protein
VDEIENIGIFLLVINSPVGYGDKAICLLRISHLIWKRKKQSKGESPQHFLFYASCLTQNINSSFYFLLISEADEDVSQLFQLELEM